MIQNKTKGFTLVELIVVITILAILGTIAFISLQGYSKSARDSTRISDVKSIKTALELFSLQTGYYPEPSDGMGVTLSGAEVWTQGVVGDSVISILQRIDKKPVDPLTSTQYTYSRLNTKKEFELAAVLEDSHVAFSNNEVQAEGMKLGTAHVSGTYNSVTSKVKIGNMYYLLALPSIIANDLSLTQIEDIIDNNKFVYNGYKNLPANHAGTNYNLNGEENLNLVNTLVVYTGLELPDNKAQFQSFAQNLQAAYSGTLLKYDGNYTHIVNVNTADPVALESLGKTIFNTALGGKEKISTNTSDVGAPIGGDFTLPATTNTTNITLTITCPTDAEGNRPIEMYISGDIVGNPMWETCGSSKNVTLTNGDGNKTISVKWRDSKGNETISLDQSILLSTFISAPLSWQTLDVGDAIDTECCDTDYVYFFRSRGNTNYQYRMEVNSSFNLNNYNGTWSGLVWWSNDGGDSWNQINGNIHHIRERDSGGFNLSPNSEVRINYSGIRTCSHNNYGTLEVWTDENTSSINCSSGAGIDWGKIAK